MSRRANGFSLVELLVALALGGLLLAGAWLWFATVMRAGAATARAAEASTSLAFARRVILADLRAATGLSPAASSGKASVALAVPVARHADGLVQIVWDQGRGILWRLTASSHLAEGVEDFSLSYFDGAGRPVACQGMLDAAQVSTVRRVTVDLTISINGARRSGHWPIGFGEAEGR